MNCLLSKLLNFIRTGVGIGRIFGADINFTVFKHFYIEWNNRNATLIDGLRRCAQVTCLNALAPNRRNVSVVEGGALPAALLVLKRRAMPQEAPDKLTFAVGACDFIGGAIIEIV